MLARGFCHSQTVNGNTSRGWRQMAQMIMEPPTDFATESRSAELSLKKKRVLGRYSQRTDSSGVCVCTGQWKHFIPYAENCKVEVFLLQ